MTCQAVHSVEELTTHSTGQAVAVGLFVSSSVVGSGKCLVTHTATVGLACWTLLVGLLVPVPDICSVELLSTHITTVGLCGLQVGLHVA